MFLALLIKMYCIIKNIEAVSAKVLYLSKKGITLLTHCLPAHAELIKLLHHCKYELTRKKAGSKRINVARCRQRIVYKRIY